MKKKKNENKLNFREHYFKQQNYLVGAHAIPKTPIYQNQIYPNQVPSFFFYDILRNYKLFQGIPKHT